MARGYLALVLHAHLPYVRHPEDAPETYGPVKEQTCIASLRCPRLSCSQ